MIFNSYSHEGLKLKNRIVMSGMTRCRADPSTGVPSDLMKTYYSQRAESAGLIITEFQPVDKLANAWPGAGSLWSNECVKKWKEIVNAVHKHGSVFFAQVGHGGRLTHSDFINGETPLSSTTVPAPGEAHTMTGKKPYSAPKIATISELKILIQEFKKSAENALKASFDGIEISAGSGLLIEQFLCDTINKRTDEYNGPIENRARLLFEIIDEVAKVYPANRISVKLSITNRMFGTKFNNPKEDLAYLLDQIAKRNLFCVNLVEAEKQDSINEAYQQIPSVAKEARKTFKGVIITNGFTAVQDRIKLVENGEADLVSFGKYFAANPDLTIRLKNNWPLTELTWDNIYSGGDKGYTDWPVYKTKTEQSDNTQKWGCCSVF